GGGLYATNTVVVLQSCIFSNNTAVATNFAFGGGINCEAGSVLLNGSTLISNVVSGGGLQADWNKLTNWSLTAAATNAYWTAVACSANGSNVVAGIGGVLGSIYRSTNVGASWTATIAPNAAWLSIASSEDGTRLCAVGAASGSVYSPGRGYLYTSTNGGA